MAALRMSLAELRHKEEQLDGQISQFRTQLRRLPQQVIYGRTPLEASLSAMGEIEERLADAEAARRRLLTVKQAALEELAALEAVQQVDLARQSLGELRRQARAGGETAESRAERRRLEAFIAEHSRQVEQSITARWQERQGG